MSSITEGKEYPKKDFYKNADEYVRHVCSGAESEPDNTFTWADIMKTTKIDFEAGYTIGHQEGYSERSKEVRDFYLTVRDYFRATAYLSTHTKNTMERQLRLDEAAQCSKMILTALSSFTESEQQSLPFGE